MKLKKLISQANEFLDSDQRKRKEKKKYLKNVLKKLRKYEDELCERLKTETDPEQIEKLNQKKTLAHTQRKKGVALLKTLQSDGENGD